MNSAIVLAGGMGTRLQSVTQGIIPKPMVLVKGKPFLYWLLRYLRREGIQDIILAISHRAEVIEKYFGNSYEGLSITYSIEEKPMGTGGAIKQALTHTKSNASYVINGDTYFPVNLREMQLFHNRLHCDVTMALKFLRLFDRYGSITIDSNQLIRGFYEKKFIFSGYINGGIYLMNRHVLDSFDPHTPFSVEKDFFEKPSSFILAGYRSRANFIDIGIPEEYQRIQTFKFK